jgi:cytochrome b
MRVCSIQIWDLPVRLFHWAIVVLVFASWLTQEAGWMEAHFICGYTIAAGLLFRIAWGFIGSDTARFSRFLKSPVAALVHLARFGRREPDQEIGHNAAGGWMVLGMLVLLAIQVCTGLCATDDVMTEGPFSELVGQTWSDRLSHIHYLAFYAIEAAVALHVLAVLAYAVVKRHDLIRPMVTGRKRLPPLQTPPRLASPWLALALFALAGGIVGFSVTYW